ncbi:MAG TPA: hypothetical protein VGY99_04585 [Candidatus Binataceae bacterium]|jgi:hypothetical protein|nr:hypothetical protein [Candidatus Binataceae bacterium]
MSYELIAILVVGAAMSMGQFAAIVIAISGLGAMARGFEAMDARFEKTTREINRGFDAMDARFEKTTREMNRGFEELSRTHRAIAALVVQESEKIQTLLRT